MILPNPKSECLAGYLALFFLLILARPAHSAAQETHPISPYYARTNTFGIFVGFSGNSRHILLGEAEKRKLLHLGFSYSRRLMLDNVFNWQYNMEFMPVAMVADPLTEVVVNQISPTPSTYSYSTGSVVTCGTYSEAYSVQLNNGFTYSGTETASCAGHKWTMGEAISPLGFNWNFLPRHRVQPLFTMHGGYMFSRHQIPIAGADKFNFTFDGGPGVEIFAGARRSIRVEYRVHHISNKNMATYNPGIDNGVLQVMYCFGR